jgi:hypothetical protein
VNRQIYLPIKVPEGYTILASKRLESLLLGQIVHVKNLVQMDNLTNYQETAAIITPIGERKIDVDIFVWDVVGALIDCDSCMFPKYLVNPLYLVKTQERTNCIAVWKGFNNIKRHHTQSMWRAWHINEGILKWKDKCPLSSIRPRNCHNDDDSIDLYLNNGEDEGCDTQNRLVCKCDDVGFEHTVLLDHLLRCPIVIDQKPCHCVVDRDHLMEFIFLTIVCSLFVLYALKWRRKVVYFISLFFVR